MKVTCQSCTAKYTIADEKVLGKAVKIRCKKCGATILLDASDPTGVSSSSRREPPRPDDPRQPAPEGWTVNVAEGDQRFMMEAEIATAFRSGTIDLETYCWKDGMDDWLPLGEIEPLRAACTPAAVRTGDAAPEMGAAGQDLSPLAPLPERAGAADAGRNGSGASSAATAKRAAGRAPAADLFAAAARAGGEEDVLTSAPARLPQPHEEAQKVTGARNESSVLFSLSALTSKPNDRPPLSTSEASGLIDIRQLSAQLAVEEKKSSRVDDIMNLSGGGAFSPTLTAAVFAPPPLDAYGPSTDSAAPGRPSGRSKGLIVLALGAGVLVIVGTVGAASLFMHSKGTERSEKGKAEPGSESALAAAPAPSDTPNASAAAPPAAAEPATANAAKPQESANARKDETNTGDTNKGEAKASSNAPAPKQAPPNAQPIAPRAAAPPAFAAPAADTPFNLNEARSRLTSVASAAQTCKRPGGPLGTGRVVVVFAPSGVAQNAAITGPPFEGTSTGACVAGRFRAVRVPAFSGSPYSVAKSFTIN
jgi:predicted Zn finger-like uncharacterized protein